MALPPLLSIFFIFIDRLDVIFELVLPSVHLSHFFLYLIISCLLIGRLSQNFPVDIAYLHVAYPLIFLCGDQLAGRG